MAGSVIAEEKSKKPNVLFVAIDDLNDWVGFLGTNPDTRTPNMDRLAKRSLVFTNAHCAAPACVPSRNAMFTGVSPMKSGLYSNFGGSFRSCEYSKDAVTLTQHFMEHDYRAIGVGKILHGNDKKSWHDYGKPRAKKHMPTHEGYSQKWGMLDVPKEEMEDWKRASWAVEQMEQGQPEPFFLACGFHLPHVDWHCPRPYFEKFPLDKISLPPIKLDDYDDIPGKNVNGATFQKGIDSGEAIKAVQGYLACINFVDECVGRLIDALDASPYKDNTVIVLWSDHGMHVGEKLRYGKFALWEESAHNLLLFAAPSVGIKPGRCDEAVNLIDIYPTLIDLCGLTKREGLDGISLMPQLKNPSTPKSTPSITSNAKECNSVRTKRWRYIRYADGSEELYDHDNDPNEWTNLANNPEYASVIANLKNFIPKEQASPMSETPENVAKRASMKKKKSGKGKK